MTTPAIIEIDKGITLKEADVIKVFSDKKKLNPYVDKIKNAVHSDNIDLKTKKGRDDIASRAHKVSKMKTALVKAGKSSVSDLKLQVANVNEGVKYLTSLLDDLRDETRDPLSKWEAEEKRKEEERKTVIQERIKKIHLIGFLTGGESIEDLSGLIDAVTNIDCGYGFDEFATDALKAVADVKEKLTAAMQDLISKQQLEEAERKVAEEEKKLSIEKRISALKMIPVDMMEKSSKEIQTKIDSLLKFTVPVEDFGDRANEAEEAKQVVITQLRSIHGMKLAQESSQAKTQCNASNHEEHHQSDPVQSETYTSPEGEMIVKDDFIDSPQSESVTSIIICNRGEGLLEEYDSRDRIEVVQKDITGENTIFCVHDGEPEDSNLSRNFSDCYNVVSLMKMAYEAGVNGEAWEFGLGELLD